MKRKICWEIKCERKCRKLIKQNLSKDIILEILLYLKIFDIVDMRIISKSWCNSIDSNVFWKLCVKRDLGVEDEKYNKINSEKYYKTIFQKFYYGGDIFNWNPESKYLKFLSIYNTEIYNFFNDRIIRLALDIHKNCSSEYLKAIISNHKKLTHRIIYYFSDQTWNWDSISYYTTLTLPFVKKYKNYLQLDWLSVNSTLTPEMIEYIGISKLDWEWESISRYCKLSYLFIRNNIDKLYIDQLIYNKTFNCKILFENNLSGELKDELNFILKMSKILVLINPKLESIKDLEIKHNSEDKNKNSKNVDIEEMSYKDYFIDDRSIVLSIKLIKTRVFNINDLSANPTLTSEIIDYIGSSKLNWKLISKNIKLNTDLIQRYVNKWDIYSLLNNKTLMADHIKILGYDKAWGWDDIFSDTTDAYKMDVFCDIESPNFTTS